MAMNSKEPAVGIDLGTTYSVIAYINETGRPETIVNEEGDLLTPSIVLFDEGEIIVGKEALKAVSTDMAHVADCPKRQVGRVVYEKVIDGRRYPPEALQAWILKKLCRDAARQVGEFSNVVVTVPAYFDEGRRKSTMDAGYIAGVNVIDIINEPTAAAIAYGWKQGWLDEKGSSHAPINVLVYDLGGGTFDVTVMRIEGERFTAIATDGDVQLGGRDWDQRIVDTVAEDYIRKFGQDPREDPNTFGQLWRDSQEAKETLSARSKATVRCTYNDCTVNVTITRDQFEELTTDLLERTSFTTRQVLAAAKLEWSDIDRTLLVGGSTRMPQVRALVKELSGKQPDTSISPDEAVALGAAIRSGILQKKYDANAGVPKIKNVNSHSLGVVANNVKTKQQQVAVIIPRNTPLPVVAKRIFKTHRTGQESILALIVEGESPSPDDCLRLGKCSIWDLPDDLPVGSEIEVLFKYEENGRLIVQVKVQGAKQPFRYQLERFNSLTDDQLNSWREFICD
jgi:molecular chaperone DnaK